MVRHFRVALGAAALAAVAVPALAQSGDHPGKAPYDRVCGVCHGPDGQGNVAPPLVPLEKDFDEVLAIVREGRGEMPPQSANAVSDDALKLIVEYLRSQPKEPATGPRRAAASRREEPAPNNFVANLFGFLKDLQRVSKSSVHVIHANHPDPIVKELICNGWLTGYGHLRSDERDR